MHALTQNLPLAYEIICSATIVIDNGYNIILPVYACQTHNCTHFNPNIIVFDMLEAFKYVRLK